MNYLHKKNRPGKDLQFLSPQVYFSKSCPKAGDNVCGAGFNISNNNTRLISHFNSISELAPVLGVFSNISVISQYNSNAFV